MTPTVDRNRPQVLADEYEHVPVPPQARRSPLAVWLGFPMILTCAVFGGLIVYSLGSWTACSPSRSGTSC